MDSIHGVFGDTHDPSSPVSAQRRRAIETYHREADLALELDAPMVVVHPAPVLPVGQRPTPAQRDERIDPMRRSMDDLAKLGDRLGVVFLIENLPHEALFGADAIMLAELIRRTDAPQLRMCFDVGHANITHNPAHAIDRVTDVIAYLHVHDNDAKVDDHRMPGDGTIDWAEIGAALRRNALAGSIMFEVFYPHAKVDQWLNEAFIAQMHRWLVGDGASSTD